MVDSSSLSDTAGSVLDPIVAVRRTALIQPQETVTVHLYLGVGEDRDHALGLVEKYQDRYMGDRVTELAWTHTQVMLRQLNATEADAQVFARLASAIIYPSPARRAPPMSSPGTGAARAGSGATASRATIRSSSSASRRRPGSGSSVR